MLQRFVISAVLMFGAVAHFRVTLQVESAGPQIMDISMGILLLAGLWTPVVGTIISGRELWIAFSGGDPWMPIVLATFGATLAMIGPGAWSLDARLFGRRQIKRLT